MTARIVLLDAVSPLLARLLRDAGHEVVDASKSSDAERAAAVTSAHALVVRSRSRIDAATIDAAPSLRAIGRAGAGTDTIDTAHAQSRGVEVLTVPGGNDVAVAELTLTLMLALARKIVPAAVAARAGEWAKSKSEGFELAGERLGIIGMGKIGGRVAQLARSFGMEVLGHDPYVEADAWDSRGVQRAPLEELLPVVRFLTIHVPLTSETRSILGAAELARMRPDAYIINCARGGVVDEDALADALEAGRLAGAALDVFRHEPELPARLISHPAVLATPHIGGSTVQAQEKIAALLAQSLARFFAVAG